MFGARFKGLSLYFLYQKRNLIRIKTGLDTYLIRIQTRTPCHGTPLMIILMHVLEIFFASPRKRPESAVSAQTIYNV